MAEAAGTGSSAGFRYWSPADRQPSAAMLKGPLEEGANANGVKQVVLVWGGGVHPEPNHSGSLRPEPNLNHPIKQMLPSSDTLLLTA